MVKPSRKPLSAEQLARRAEIGEQRRARTRAGLVAAAYSLFAKHGADIPTIDDVLAKAKVSRGTFYNHFKTRDGLFRAVAAEIADTIDEFILGVFEGLEDPALRISVAFRLFTRFALEDKTRAWIWLRTTPVAQAGGARNLTVALNQEFESALTSGRFKAPSVDAAVDLAIGCQLMTIRRLLIEECSLEYVEEAAQMLLLALGVPADEAAVLAYSELPPDQIS